MAHKYDGYPANSLSEALLLALLDQKQIPSATKVLVRNLMAPSIEAIENCTSPQEVITTIEMIIRMVVPAITLGIGAAVLEDKIDEVRRQIAEGFYQDMIVHAEMLEGAYKQAKELRNEARKLDK